MFTIRSERQLMEQISYNMLFRWFVGLAMDVSVWDVTVFTKNRDRLLQGDIARGFLAAILVDPQVKSLLSSEHFSVDGTLIGAMTLHRQHGENLQNARKVAPQASLTTENTGNFLIFPHPVKLVSPNHCPVAGTS